MQQNKLVQFLKSAVWLMLFVFTLSIIITGIILAGRISEFVSLGKSRAVINLDSKQVSVVEKDTAPSASNDTAAPSDTQQPSQNVPFNPGFEASDDEGVWQQNQQVEIFRIKYDETGKVTVDGVNDSVIAPGTSNIYNFTFKNTGNVALEYILTAEAEFSNQEFPIPLKVRMYDQTGKYIVGNKTEFDDFIKLNTVSDKAGLSPKCFANYAFEWQWPFEGDDKYDTLLGDMAVSEDLEAIVRINVHAKANPDSSGGNPYTGDGGISPYIIINILSLMAIVAFILIIKKKEAREDE